jgi:hypothetical protein
VWVNKIAPFEWAPGAGAREGFRDVVDPAENADLEPFSKRFAMLVPVRGRL